MKNTFKSTSKSQKKLQINTTDKPSNRFHTLENNFNDHFPKNANEFRHIIEDLKCCKADVEFMLELRRNTKGKNFHGITGTEPSFYRDDLTKYKTKSIYKPEEKKMLKTNLGRYKYIISDRAHYAINFPTFKYEVKLRTDQNDNVSKSLDKIKLKENNEENNEKNKNKKNLKINIKEWDSTTIPKSQSLFNTLLPPILTMSKDNFAKNEKRVGRPVIIKKKDGFINGVKVKSRIFDYNSTLALRYPSDHLPNWDYKNDYGVGNLGEISHLLKSDNMTLTNKWYSYLRGIKKKFLSPENIKSTEKRLRDKSNQKSNLKI
jgi:hypothetical protein